MRLTPLEIKKQEFKKTFRGLDPIEVETFLEMVAEEFEALIGEKNNLSDAVLKLQTQLGDYQSVEKTLKETLVNAQQTINESRENSQRQAELIVHEAELKAEQILENAKLRLAKLKNDLVLVKAQKDSFARRLRHLLDSQLDLIGVLELDDLGFDKFEQKNRKPLNTSKVEEEKIEFEGVEDVIPEEPNFQSQKDEIKTSDFEAAPDLNWQKKLDSDEESEESKQAKNKRISDQLII